MLACSALRQVVAAGPLRCCGLQVNLHELDSVAHLASQLQLRTRDAEGTPLPLLKLSYRGHELPADQLLMNYASHDGTAVPRFSATFASWLTLQLVPPESHSKGYTVSLSSDKGLAELRDCIEKQQPCVLVHPPRSLCAALS